MALISSLVRFWRIRRISKILSASLGASASTGAVFSERTSKRERALEELLQLCASNSTLGAIMANYGVGRKELRKLYHTLLAAGGGQWAGPHFVPVSTLSSPFPLGFVLDNSGKLPWEHIVVLLLEYFERNELGPVSMEFRGPVDPDSPLKAIWELQQRAKSSVGAMRTEEKRPGPWDRDLIERKRRGWFEEGRSKGFRYMLVCQDTFDSYDSDMGLYPAFFRSQAEAQEFQAKQLTGIDILVEVLDLSRSLDEQLTEPMRRTIKDLG